jgi:hypothetical protein
MFYVYVIHFEDFFYYVGKRKCPDKFNPWNDPYKGSPKTHKEKWKTTKFTKVIIECFDNDKNVSAAETNLLLQLDWENDPYCLNECCGGKFSYEANRRGALSRNKIPIKQSTKDKISQRYLKMWKDPNWNKKEKILNILRSTQAKATKASTSPEAIKKKKEKLKEIKHQQGEKNSQYGTILIHNLELRQTKRIKKDDPIPFGWEKGAIYDFDAYFERQKRKEEYKINQKIKKQNKRNEKIKLYTEWYKIYKQTNFTEFCSITGYYKSQQNLCAKFKEFVKAYSPKANNGRCSLDNSLRL